MSSMATMKQKFLTQINIFTLILFVLSAVVYGLWIPQYYLGIYLAMLVYFYFLGFVGVQIYSRALEQSPASAGNKYLLVRMTKMLLSLLLALVYCIAWGHVIQFLIPFAILYLLYLIFETWFYAHCEMLTKQKKGNDESK